MGSPWLQLGRCPGRRIVLCSGLINMMEKCAREGVINRRSRWWTGLPIWAVKIFSPKSHVIVLSRVQSVHTRTPDFYRVYFNIIIPRLNTEGEVQETVCLVLTQCLILSSFRRFRHAYSLFGVTIFGPHLLQGRSSTLLQNSGEIQHYIVKPTT